MKKKSFLIAALAVASVGAWAVAGIEIAFATAVRL